MTEEDIAKIEIKAEKTIFLDMCDQPISWKEANFQVFSQLGGWTVGLVGKPPISQIEVFSGCSKNVSIWSLIQICKSEKNIFDGWFDLNDYGI